MPVRRLRAVYESLHGRLTRKEPAFVVVTAGGIGYRVLVPLSTFEVLPRTGQDAELLLHLVVREDEWRLFGFATDDEREAVIGAVGATRGVIVRET